MDAGFERVDRDMRDLRSEIGQTNERIDGLNESLSGRLDGLSESLNQTILRVGGAMTGGMMVGFLSVIAAVLTTA